MDIKRAPMVKSTVITFSKKKDNLNQIFSEINDFFGVSVNHAGFSDKTLFLNSLNNNSGRIKLIIVDIQNVNDQTIQFIETINDTAPEPVKLVIGDTQNLLQVQLGINCNHQLHFLRNPWSKADMLLSLNSLTANYRDSQLERINTAEENIINDRVEKEISNRLKELIEANYAKDRFLSIIAHDLKTPFLGLLGISEILLNDWKDLSEDNKTELLTDIHETSENTYKLLQDLLGWAKNQRDKLEVSIEEIMIHNLVDSSIKISENNAIPKGIKVQNEIDNKLKVNADEKMMATVFRNLISNAVKFTQPGGKINISAKEEKNYCTFCVADNGSGIDKKEILEMFNVHNVKRSNGNRNGTTKFKSNFKGLGLILCKDFVEKQGGKIWVETNKGRGSKFYFTVPC